MNVRNDAARHGIPLTLRESGATVAVVVTKASEERISGARMDETTGKTGLSPTKSLTIRAASHALDLARSAGVRVRSFAFYRVLR